MSRKRIKGFYFVQNNKNDNVEKLKYYILNSFNYNLTIYHVLGIFQNELGLDSSQSNFNDYYTLITIARIFVPFVFMMFTLKNKLIAKIIFGENYIGGKYVGKSERQIDGEIIHEEYFEIKQSLMETTISGMSDENDKFYGSWKGKLNEIDNKHFKFMIIVNSSSRTHDGILSLRFDDDKAYGFYNSTILGRENYRRKFEAKKK